MSDNLTVVGNVASVPELRELPNGGRVLSFRLASNHRRFDARTGEWQNAGTNWFSVSAYRALGENAHASLSKGDSVIVTGVLRVRDWEANGRRGTSVDLDADAIGPDLRWGTAAYTRHRRADQDRRDTADGAAGSPSATSSRPSDATEVSTPTDAPSEDAWRAPGELVDVPF